MLRNFISAQDIEHKIMRLIIAASAILAVSAMTPVQSSAQTNSYNRCVEQASRQGLNANSSSGRKYVHRCMQRAQTPRPSRNCPDDPRARSAFPAWMCP
jgi:hypothetical protein